MSFKFLLTFGLRARRAWKVLFALGKYLPRYFYGSAERFKVAQNQHFISKIVTKPWLTSANTLHYFDFEINKMLVAPQNDLFAKRGLWDEKLESVFDKKFERRIREDIRNFTQLPNAPVSLSWEQFRAIILMHLFNVLRSMKANLEINTVEKFSQLSNDQMNKEIEEFIRPYELLRVPVNPVYRMFYSDLGFFHIPLIMSNSNEMDIGFAIPVTPYFALGLFPRGFDLNALREIIEASDTYFLKLSVGMSGRRLVVHPDIVTEDNLIQKILDSRQINQKAATLAQNSSLKLRERITASLKDLKG